MGSVVFPSAIFKLTNASRVACNPRASSFFSFLLASASITTLAKFPKKTPVAIAISAFCETSFKPFNPLPNADFNALAVPRPADSSRTRHRCPVSASVMARERDRGAEKPTRAGSAPADAGARRRVVVAAGAASAADSVSPSNLSSQPDNVPNAFCAVSPPNATPAPAKIADNPADDSVSPARICLPTSMPNFVAAAMFSGVKIAPTIMPLNLPTPDATLCMTFSASISFHRAANPFLMSSHTPVANFFSTLICFSNSFDNPLKASEKSAFFSASSHFSTVSAFLKASPTLENRAETAFKALATVKK